MNAVYPAALVAFLTGAVDVTTDVLRAQLVTAGYSYNATHEHLSSVPGGVRVSTPATITGVTVAAGTVSASPITFPAVAAGSIAAGLVVFVESGADATRQLLVYVDRRGDTVPIDITTNGGDVTLVFDRLFKI